MDSSPLPAFGQTRMGPINRGGLWTLYKKEVRRFLKVVTQTVLAPIVTTLLFLLIFTLAFGKDRPPVNGVPFEVFLAPGLVMMAVVQNAFANTSSSMMVAKIQGNLVDYLLPPLGPGELTFAWAMGGVTRGLLVAAATIGGMALFVGLPVHAFWAIAAFILLGATILSLLGLLAGIWAEKFDHMAAITNFVITPLAFLSGTFYSIDRLPAPFNSIAQANPFFWLIDGFRYGFIGRADGSIWVALVGLTIIAAAMWFTCYRVLKSGWKLKS